MVRANKTSTGAYDLNKFLFGGYDNDIITTIYGPGGSGKSNLCMMISASQAKKGNKVIFVDTEGGFSSERFKQIHQGDKEEIEKSLENILLLKPTSFNEQEKAFETLLKNVNKKSVSLIIIDSIVMLYRLELGEAITSKDDRKIAIINRKLAKQLRILNEIARKENIPVIVTNQVYSEFVRDIEKQNIEKQVSMVGGDLLKYWSKCLIELKTFKGKRKLVLKKHRSLPVKEFSFEILNIGIRKRGIF
tara:strand:- start:13367 stop:14107 length:741 start_codon:yes stop_codon:yes gene_type:complete